MTSADFAAKYKILKRITEQGVRSYNAQQTSTNRPVMVHFLDGGPTDLNHALFASLHQLDPGDRGRIIEASQVDGTTVIVTQFLAGFVSFESWIESRVPGFRTPAQTGPTVVPPLSSPAPAPSSSAIDSLPQGDPSFSSLWQVGQGPPAAAQGVPPTPPAASTAGSPPVQAGSVGPPVDEFSAPTQLMNAPAIPTPRPPVSEPTPPPAAPVKPDRNVEHARLSDAIERLEPGEFTRMFSAKDAPPPASPAVGQPRPPAAPAARTHPPVKPSGRAAPPPPPASPPLARSEPGEFTRLFQSPPRDPAPLPSSPVAPAPFAAPPPAFVPRPPEPVTPPAPAPMSMGLPPQEPNRVFELPIPVPPPSREVPGGPVVPPSAHGPTPASVTGMLAARQAEPAPPPPPIDLFGFGTPAAQTPVAPTPPATGSPAGSPSFAIPSSVPGVPAIPPLFPTPPAPPAPPASIVPPGVIPPVLAAPSIAAAAGAAITFGVSSTPPSGPGAQPGSGPSEFTRILKGVAAPAAVGAIATAAALAAQKKKDEKAAKTGPSILPLVIALNLLGVAAIGLILYFVLKG